MNRTWLLLDVSGMAHRAMHTTGALKYDGVGPTGVLFGMFGSLLDIQREFQTQHTVFCFDSRTSRRAELYPQYKLQRKTKEYTKEEQKMYNGLHKQIKKLRKKYLKQIGHVNVFYQKGYEADDIIASVCANLPKGDSAIIVSSDFDFFQLLRKNVSIWRPVAKELWSKARFRNQYGIRPRDWALVKALAGCDTDEVVGIKGVGEITAAKYIRGDLTKGKAFDLIRKHEKKMVKRNLPLVKLPFEGTKDFVPKPDGRLTGWADFCRELGFRSLM